MLANTRRSSSTSPSAARPPAASSWACTATSCPRRSKTLEPCARARRAWARAASPSTTRAPSSTASFPNFMLPGRSAPRRLDGAIHEPTSTSRRATSANGINQRRRLHAGRRYGGESIYGEKFDPTRTSSSSTRAPASYRWRTRGPGTNGSRPSSARCHGLARRAPAVVFGGVLEGMTPSRPSRRSARRRQDDAATCRETPTRASLEREAGPPRVAPLFTSGVLLRAAGQARTPAVDVDTRPAEVCGSTRRPWSPGR